MWFPGWARIEADGYAVAPDPDVERTALEDGLVRQERRYSSAMTVRSIRGFVESDADYVRFRAWAAREAHAWFDWTDPEDGVVRPVRVRGGAGGIRYTARARDGARSWDFEMQLEGLP
ncbi:MAG: hypothetical protein OXC28_07100 [Defluviicoccus sp.]|nr:hypothetical protein [Defluviicoccus sp.]